MKLVLLIFQLLATEDLFGSYFSKKGIIEIFFKNKLLYLHLCMNSEDLSKATLNYRQGVETPVALPCTIKRDMGTYTFKLIKSDILPGVILTITFNMLDNTCKFRIKLSQSKHQANAENIVYGTVVIKQVAAPS